MDFVWNVVSECMPVDDIVLARKTYYTNIVCERKAGILKGKINQAISLRSFEQLVYFCECLSVLDYFAESEKENLYQMVQDVFKRAKPIKMKISQKPKSESKTD